MTEQEPSATKTEKPELGWKGRFVTRLIAAGLVWGPVFYFLNDSLEESRSMSKSEIEHFQEFYGASIDFNKVSFETSPWSELMRKLGEFEAAANENNIKISPKIFHAGITKKHEVRTVAHELAHVLQHQKGEFSYLAHIWQQLAGFIQHKNIYDYDLSPDRFFEDYGIEQQAAIIEDYYMMTRYDELPHNYTGNLSGDELLKQYERIIYGPSSEPEPSVTSQASGNEYSF